MEIWRPIDGYENLYQVSNLGRVRRLHKTIPPRILKAWLDNRGYPKVSLCRDGKIKGAQVHRLVAMAFIPNPDGKPEVNHIDGNPRNNCVENLEWCTRSENVRHAYATGLSKSGEERSDAKLTAAQVVYIRDNPDDLLQRELAQMFGVDRKTIGDIQRGQKYRNAGGNVREPKHEPANRAPDNVREQIKAMYVYGSREFGSTALARKFNVHPQTILNIVHEN